MTNQKKYWQGLAELNNDPIVEKISQNEFVDEIPVDDFLSDSTISDSKTSRRDFLKFLGFSTAAATLAACEAPVNKVIPYVVKPEEIVPGVANFYASTIFDGHDFASVLVKTREGRPIKLLSNNTGTNARVQASVLSLYDTARLKKPIKNGEISDWDTIDSEIKTKLSSISENSGKIAILTSTIISPTTESIINQFSDKYKNVSHVQVDSISYQGILEANSETFGIRRMPNYYFEKADVIVSFGADFIANWGGNPNYECNYVKGRNPKSGKMSKHFQIESTLTLTGSNADYRIQIKPSEQSGLIYNLYNSLKGSSPDPRLKNIVKALKGAKSSIVLSNSNDKKVQLLVNSINQMLGNYKSTIDMKNYSNLRKGNDKDFDTLVKDMNEGKIKAIITYNVNPSYTSIDSQFFNKGLSKVGLKISTSMYMDETSSKMDYICPDSHNLESWGDMNPSYNDYTLMQPTINPLFDTRQFQNSILKWSDEKSNYYDILKNSYDKWDEKLHDGYFTLKNPEIKLKSNFKSPEIKGKIKKGIEIEVAEKISMGDGKGSNNPWLQELPDPLSRACWDNYLTISATTAQENNIKNWNVSNGALNGSLVNITVNGEPFIDQNGNLINLPVMIQPGQAKDTVSLAVGYGRTHSGKCGNGIGINAFPLSKGGIIEISVVEEDHHEFALVQLHSTMMGREIVKETTLADYIKNPASGNYKHEFYTHEGFKPPDQVTLWDSQDHETGHFWNQSIDLTLCTGCAACVISCHAENNVPVVGKKEVRDSRDMHWLRIDRYFSSDMTKELSKKEKVSAINMYAEMEDPSENPEVVFQPMMCQHCNNAPCETVCPVAATTHSAEGLNHMTYNRCVGTRYCANNCPYKVRRFNWFKYHDNDKFDFNMNNDYGKMVLNPDVVVRSRGVIEKCSMCIQMIQEIKLKAKLSGKPVSDEDVQTACSSACSTGAMVFGDVNNKEHMVHKLKKDERAYDLLDHLNVAPSVFYQTKIRNK